LFKASVSIICFLLCGTLLFAQKNTSVNDQGYILTRTLTDSLPDSKSTYEKDLMDVLHGIGKKSKSQPQSIAQKKVLFSFVPAMGYTLSTGFVGLVSANAAFYLSDTSATNISSISTGFNYSQYHQITIPVQANIWTKDNNFNIITDWRYFKYPQDTYGLGAHSIEANADRINYSHIRLHQSVLKKVTGSFYLGGGYMLDKRWKIKEEGNNENVTAYGLERKSVSSGYLVNVLYDSRKNSINPAGGFYANARYRDNLTFLGSNTDWQSLVLEFRKYINFPAGSRNTLALWNFNWLTLAGKPAYLDLPSTSWDPSNNTGRGYIQGRFRSRDMLYFETEYRFSLTRNGLLGGVIFGNAQSFSNWPSDKFDRIIPGTGLGLRIKVNKASRTNIAIDYGFGVKGSRGLFVNLGEVF
jgi:hypothetical protein